MNIRLVHKFEDFINIDNLLDAWREFVAGKRNRLDVQWFSFSLMDNIFSLRDDFINHNYKHGGYQTFKICDPKPRIIHKASVRDRVLHHAIYRILYPFFNKIFISDSFSCRDKKGSHKAINRFRKFACIVSKNNTKTCWVLKCDIQKFFYSVDHEILIKILENYIPDENIINLLKKIIFSFHSTKQWLGLPLGNLTSQLFANIYLNELDQFIKHKLKVKYYIRYTDDFVIFSEDRDYLKKIIPIIKIFLQNDLKLTIHPDKIFIKTLFSGMDFLGWINFKDHRILRNKTKKRIFERIKDCHDPKTFASYLGVISHGNANGIKNKILKVFFKNYNLFRN